MYFRHHLFLKASTIFCCIIVAFSCGFAPFAHRADAAPAIPSYQATLVVNPGNPGFSVPTKFLGFSIEATNSCYVVDLAQQNPAFVNLFNNLGAGNMRYGGTTVENTTWSPNGTPSCYWNNTVITQSLINSVFAFAQQIGWTVSWTVPLNNFDPTQYVDEASYAANEGGSSLSSIEFGNEPNRYGISFSQYITNWETYYNTFRVNNPTAPISGPSVNPDSPQNGNWFSKFLGAEGSKLAFATAHRYYGTPGGPHPPTITDLLSQRIMQGAAVAIQNMYQITQQQHLPLVINETNNYDLGGQPGVSDVFAASLWGSDYLLTGLENGAVQMEFHGMPNNPNGNNRGTLNYCAPINDDGTPTPLYYAMLLYHYAASIGGQEVPVQITSQSNLSAHAILGSNGQLNLVIINKDETKQAKITINTTQSFKRAIGVSLLAPSLSSTTDITFGGSSIGADGTWHPTVIKHFQVNGATLKVTIPAGSAIVITYI